MAAEEDHDDLSLFHLATAKLSDAQKLTDEAHDLLKQDLEKVREEKSTFEKMMKTLNQVHFAGTVKLNVGGKIYKTTLNTLRKDPDSMLCAMFSGRYEVKADEEDGAYFIDRDGKLFQENFFSQLKYILNYLRNGEFRCPKDRTIQQDLLSEAKFYQVQGIIDQLEQAIFPLASSVIKNKDHRLAIMSWLPEGAACSLLYLASADGKTAKDFHRCCDNKGPTLVVIKSGEFICGGYTSKSWSSPSSNKEIADNQCFLFTLANPSRTEPIKITPKRGAAAGIRCGTGLGPRFIEKNNALDVDERGSGLIGTQDLSSGFLCPQNADHKTFFTGKPTFNVSELEVFQVDF